MRRSRRCRAARSGCRRCAPWSGAGRGSRAGGGRGGGGGGPPGGGPRGRPGGGGVRGCAHGRLPAVAPGDEYDVVVAGGGLGLLLGLALARFGWRVLVFDRDQVGCAHREWNISRRELAVLVADGLFTWDELDGCVATTYEYGVLSFDATGTGLPPAPLRLQGVLDTALDAQRLLTLARARFLAAGGAIREGRRFLRLHSAAGGPVRGVLDLAGPDGAPE